MIQILSYITPNGRDEFGSWLERQNRQVRTRIQARIDRLELGNFGDHKAVGAGVLELRIHYGPGYRVYLGRDGDLIVVLLSGGVKKNQEKDIKHAIASWNTYKEEKRNARKAL